MPTTAPRPNGRLMVVESQFFNRMKRQVAIANGMIGRPDSRASMMMPSPTTRARFGTSAVVAMFQLSSSALQHFAERADAALAMKGAAVIAGAADGADAEPLGGNGVELAVAMPRDQHLGAMARLGLDERRHEMLAVPEREDRRHLRLDALVDIGRVVAEAVGQPDQPQKFSRKHTQRALNRGAAQPIAKETLQRLDFLTGGLGVLTGVEQPVEVNDEVPHMGIVDGLLRLRLPGRESRCVVRIHADDLDLVEILESRVFEIGQFAADDEMKQLLWRTVWHDVVSQ